MECIFKSKNKCSITKHNCSLGTDCPKQRDPETCGYSRKSQSDYLCELVCSPCDLVGSCPALNLDK